MACARSRAATRSRSAADNASIKPAAACGFTGSTLGPAKYAPCTKSTLHSSAISASRSVRQAAHQHQLPGLVQQRDEPRQHAFDMRMLARLRENAAVERDDIGPQIPHAVDVRMLGAEAVQRDQEARFAQRVDDFGKARGFAARLLRHFQHHALRRQAERLQAGEQRVAVAGVHQRRGMQAQEEPFVVAVERIEVAQMQRFGEPPEFQQIAAPRGLGENLMRRHLQRMFVMGAQRSVITDRAPVRHRKHRLEHAEHRVAAVQDGAPGAFVARHRARRLEAGRIEFDHAHHVSVV